MTDQPALNRLIVRLTRLISEATGSLESVYPDGVDAWQEELSRQLARYHTAAMLAGGGATDLTPAMAAAVRRDLATQFAFLNRFAVEVRAGRQWQRGWNSRAASYANGIKVPYWRGKVKMLPLPAMPAEGTQCYGNCKCGWRVETVDEENNDYDAYWEMSEAEHCQTCKQRAQEWAPVRIRDGILQL